MDQSMEGANPAPGFASHPDYPIELSPADAPVRVGHGGKTLAESSRALVMREGDYAPVYYFPPDDVRLDLLIPTATSSHCPFKGEASYWRLADSETGPNETKSGNVAWSYQDPYDEMQAIRGYIAFYRDRLDDWQD